MEVDGRLRRRLAVPLPGSAAPAWRLRAPATRTGGRLPRVALLPPSVVAWMLLSLLLLLSLLSKEAAFFGGRWLACGNARGLGELSLGYAGVVTKYTATTAAAAAAVVVVVVPEPRVRKHPLVFND